MEIIWPENRCDDSPSRAHYFVGITGNIFRCKYCWRCKWLPRTVDDAMTLSTSMRKLGVEDAYVKLLRPKKHIRATLEKLEEIRLLKKSGMPQDMLMKAVAAIVVHKTDGADGEPVMEQKPTPQPVSPKTPASLVYRKKEAGRPREGEMRHCCDCGKEIYIRKYRLKQGRKYMCEGCASKRSPGLAAISKAQKVKNSEVSNT